MPVFSQNNNAAIREIISEQMRAAAIKRPALLPQINNPLPPGFTMPAGILQQPALLKQYLQKRLIPKKASALPLNKPGAARQQDVLCKDTSYSRLLGITNGRLYPQTVTQSADGGMLITAVMFDSTLLPNPYGISYGLLIKVNEAGNILWVKQFENTIHGQYSLLYMTRAFELANHDIICFGALDTTGSDKLPLIIYRLNSTGNIIWQRSYKSGIGLFNSPAGTFAISIESAVDGLNGDIILCGNSTSSYSSGHIETVIRLNSLGQLVWDANYGNHGIDGSYRWGAEGITAFLQNGQIILVGLSHGSSNPQTAPAVNFYTLDYANGNVVKMRYFKPDYTDVQEEFEKSYTYYYNRCTQLSNGHLLVYGKLFSDYLNNAVIKDHFGVMEFDASFNLVGSYTISSPISTNDNNNLLKFNTAGDGLISIHENLGGYDANLFFGAFTNLQFQNQRKANYSGVGIPGSNGFAFLKDGGYAYLQGYFKDQPGANSYFEFRKMHNSDTSSACLGKDTMVFQFLPWHIIEVAGYYLMDDNEPNKMIATQHYIVQTDTLTTNSNNRCKQTNYCDTIKIHGNPIICGATPSVLFTAFKNKECGAIVQWTVDKNALDSLRVLSDTSARMWFKNISFQGKMYASISGGACYATATDSVAISVTRATQKLSLGADTLLCTNNTLVLHAGNTFSNYQWQNGSSDSTLTVTKPGIYWVVVKDYCGNSLTDSIKVSPLNLSVNVGNDRMKCNNDTLHLNAPSGFMNYTWSNNKNSNLSSAQNVIINPAFATSYYLRAEKFAGCFAYDTIKVIVKASPVIQLGADKSFCAGDSAILNAGEGFAKYQWSNGSLTQQAIVYTSGSFSVTGTTADGCTSYDTLKILNVWPKPVLRLDTSSGLCANTVRILQPGSFATYLWQNGSTASSFTATGIGTFYVTVTDIHKCYATDTVKISSLLPVPVNFLPADTAICSYSQVQLAANKTYTKYLWSSGQTDASITINHPGLYTLQVTDQHSCIGKDSVNVLPKECMKGLYIPTAFSPNLDGKNDVFRPLLFGNVVHFEWKIFNRYGQIIFTATNSASGWDGSVKGILQNAGNFVWVCNYQLAGEAPLTKTGSVILVR